MADPQENPVEFVKDLVLFAPLGAFLIARERFEDFLGEAIDRGRSERAETERGVRNQVEIARSLGKSRVKKAVNEVISRSEEAPFSAVRRVGDSLVQQAQETADGMVSQLPIEPQVRSVKAAGQDVIRQAQERMGLRLAGNTSGNGDRKSSEPTTQSASGNGSPSGNEQKVTQSASPAIGDSEHLAISDYESLSAAQINARLGGLSTDELASLRTYESEHRGRKTILDRVDQELNSRS